MWKMWGRDLPNDWDINSTWVHVIGTPGEQYECENEVASQCIKEASEADAIVCYIEEGEDHPGLMAEVGAALAMDKEVFVVGIQHIQCIIWDHDNVSPFNSLDDVLKALQSYPPGGLL
jgi:nucleoside 2-deoxyribosyltransferase